MKEKGKKLKINETKLSPGIRDPSKDESRLVQGPRAACPPAGAEFFLQRLKAAPSPFPRYARHKVTQSLFFCMILCFISFFGIFMAKVRKGQRKSDMAHKGWPALLTIFDACSLSLSDVARDVGNPREKGA